MESAQGEGGENGCWVVSLTACASVLGGFVTAAIVQIWRPKRRDEASCRFKAHVLVLTLLKPT